MHAQSYMNLAYGSHHVHEIISSNATLYKFRIILYITQMETSSDRFTNLDVSMTLPTISVRLYRPTLCSEGLCSLVYGMATLYPM